MELAEIINMDDFRRRKNPVFNNGDLAYITAITQNHDSPINFGGLSIEEFHNLFWGMIAEYTIHELEQFDANNVHFSITSPITLNQFIEKYRDLLVANERDKESKSFFGSIAGGIYCIHIIAGLVLKRCSSGEETIVDYIQDAEDRAKISVGFEEKIRKSIIEAYPQQRQFFIGFGDELKKLRKEITGKEEDEVDEYLNPRKMSEECGSFTIAINPLVRISRRGNASPQILFESIYSDENSFNGKVSLYLADGTQLKYLPATAVENTFYTLLKSSSVKNQ